MEPLAARHWRWAWHCPRCGVRNPAATATCAGCDLPHALIEAPGAVVRHTCAVVGPAWATYCIGCGERLVPTPSEHASIAEGSPDEDVADAPDTGPTGEPLPILDLAARRGNDDASHDDPTGLGAGADRIGQVAPPEALLEDARSDLAPSEERRPVADAHPADHAQPIGSHVPAEAVDHPQVRLRPRHILPASDGSPEGLILTRHALLERSVERRTRAERLRLLGLLLALLLWLGLIVRALAMPGDEVLALVRAHPIPGRGGDVALTAVEGLHRILAGQPTVTPTPTH